MSEVLQFNKSHRHQSYFDSSLDKYTELKNDRSEVAHRGMDGWL